jgi:hypothetical protein
MTTDKNDIHKILVSLPLPWDTVRIIKQFIGPIDVPRVTGDDYDNYVIKLKRRHKGRAFTI